MPQKRALRHSAALPGTARQGRCALSRPAGSAAVAGCQGTRMLSGINRNKAYPCCSPRRDASVALRLPCRAHSNNTFGLLLSGLGQCATTAYTARAAPPVIVAQRRHRKRYSPNWEQQGGAELEDDFPDEACSLRPGG